MIIAETDQTDAEIVQELTDRLSLMLDKYESLRAEYEKAQERLTALEEAFSEQGCLGILQRLAADVALHPSLRIRAASAAVTFERAKPPSAQIYAFGTFADRFGAMRRAVPQRALEDYVIKTNDGTTHYFEGQRPGPVIDPDPAA